MDIDNTEKKYINNLTNEELHHRTLLCKNIFENANDAIFFGYCDKFGFPKKFIHVNNAACDLLGYTKKEILNISPESMYNKSFSDKGFRDLVEYINKKKAKVETSVKSKSGTYIPMEVNIGVYKEANKKLFLAIGRDISTSKELQEKTLNHSKLLESILIGIPDIIGVYDLDGTIIFYNEAGYNFYKKTSSEVKGKKCYEMFCQTARCEDCQMVKAIKQKRIIRKQRYISKINKYIDCCWNPVFDESGKAMFVIEQLRDITDRKRLENLVTESEENYNQIVNLLPDAVVITVDNIIVSVNKTALKYFSNALNQKIYSFAPGYEQIIKNRLSQIVENRISKTVFDYKSVINHSVYDIEVCSSYINYNGNPAVLSILRDVTKRKKELHAAALLQQKALFRMPTFDKITIETLYLPAKTVSGDFFCFHKVNEDLIIGILSDVSGKGISAALSISAFSVLFHEAVLVSEDPHEIIKILNQKIVNYLDDRYIAACCFSLDFTTNEARIVGAGINQFITKTESKPYCEQIIKGPFLGMFDESNFGEMTINFQSGDCFYFLSDGLEFIFEDDLLIEKLKKSTMNQFKQHLFQHFQNIQVDINGIKDDSTLLAIEIK